MAYMEIPPPSIEEMLESLCEWMARHGRFKITLRIEYSGGY
jgi:hypothetical protein